MTSDPRIEREIAHGKFLKENHPEDIWNWSKPAGQLRVKRRAEILRAGMTAEMNVLEIGCGTGLFTREILKSHAQITAVDISPDLLATARDKIKEPNVEFRVDNAYQLDFPEQVFDKVVGSSILHHLDMEKALAEFFRVLKPNGTLSFTEPNLLNPQIFLMKKVPALKRHFGESPDETAFVRWPLKKQIQDKGFVDVTVTPFDFLHPSLPGAVVPFFDKFSAFLERIPVVKEVAGSLRISARKP